MTMRCTLLRGAALLALIPTGVGAQLNAGAMIAIPPSPVSSADSLTLIVPVDDCWPQGAFYSAVQPTVAVTHATPPFPGTVDISLTEPVLFCGVSRPQQQQPYALPVSVGQLFPGEYTVHYVTNYRSLSLNILVSGSAPNIAPLPGLWAIASEIDGSPGRGFQLEVRGNTMVMTFYGYDTSGAGRFWLASGAYSGNTFTGTLAAYDGGTTFGGPSQSAHAAGDAGQVTLTLTSPIAGTITLPNETPKAISYFRF